MKLMQPYATPAGKKMMPGAYQYHLRNSTAGTTKRFSPKVIFALVFQLSIREISISNLAQKSGHSKCREK